VIGSYDPRKEGENYQLNLERVEYWVKNGAQPSETVASMIRKAKKRATTEKTATVEA